MKSQTLLFLIFVMMMSNPKIQGLIAANPAQSVSSLAPTNLRCEYLKNPLGIDQANPRLSWHLSSEKRNQKQYAYQLIVSTSESEILSGIGNLWDTGKVRSDQSLHISYAGKKLSSRLQVFWKVRVWDQADRPSDWSELARWEMSYLDLSDWKAKWIGAGEDQNPDSPQTFPAPYFRKEFNLKDGIQSVRAYITGLGYYEFYINGKKVGDQVLAPAQTNFDRRNMRHLLYPYDDQSSTRIFYHTFDISGYLKEGGNSAGVILGNGWYNQRDRREEGWMWYDTPRFILQIELLYKNGKREIITSDESWRFSSGALLHDAIFTGEIYDARLEPEGWSQSGFDDSGWSRAKLVRAPTGKMESQLAPADKVIELIQPVSMSKTSAYTYLYDLGQMISGWIRLKVKGQPGDTITIRYIEELGKDYRQKDILILKGNETEEYQPRFTWHAFRHVEVNGIKNTPNLEDVLGMVVNTDVEKAGTFECSNALFNKIHQNYIWTQLGNMHGCVSSDCPHRERLGYTGDGQILAESVIFNFDMTRFYHKWINDMADVQHPQSGFVPHTAPFGGGGGGPAWGSAYITVPWFYYLYYADLDILREHYDGMKKWITYLGTRTDERGLIVREEPGAWCLGDWAAPGDKEAPPPLVNTSYYYYVTTIMASVAELLQQPEDQARFTALASQILIAFNNHYFDREQQRYWEGRLGSDVFPLAFNMVAPENRASVLESLVQNIIDNKGHLDTGILATPLMLEVLTARGRGDLAYTIMDQRDYPGFGDYILGKKATTLWEYWDGALSHSHPMYGSVIRWFFKALAGINPDPNHPGFKHILIKPTLCGDLTSARGAYPSPYGRVSSSWYLDDTDLHLEVEIPANTTASVYIPATDPVLVSENGNPVTKPGQVEFVRMENNKALVSIGSGKYQFRSKNIKALIQPIHVSTPQIVPADYLFLKPDTAKISITTATNGAEIHYTFGDSKVDRDAPKYDEPILMTDATVLNARAFKEDFLPSFVKSLPINFADPLVNGLHYTVLEGEWKDRPDTTKLKPVSSGTVFQVDLKDIPRREDYVAVKFDGYLEILESGTYTFYLSANDGSLLHIDNQVIVDNAGYQGRKDTSGKVYLTKGRKAIRIFYFENAGSESIDLLYEGPGTEKQPIPANLLFKNP